MQVNLVSQPQHESLIALLCELHAYYNDGASVSLEIVRAHLLNNLLGPDSPLRLVVACDGAGHVFGFAAISLTYSLVEPTPEQNRHCQLKELYVRSSQRSNGVGKALMSWVARYAADNGCSRMDWPVKASNAKGIAFYQRLGAQQVIERLSFRLSEPGLGALASS
ncbi:GNAT family N-acetyltransferase [Rhodoferax saidenbachensis]|uniref:GNAT superfamily N-acetyltransferase n=1 Tax=Rhodoferax saidenbachensis TaxID=1484693 RepID=A0ABU1ZSD1_9BURK|nr:GNAT family N-acetyltransferase [Rhodoferax saidenbachensis]MDR7307456.1 GNAT superfamily N-acetyltransferase [Rhodoferax saidenbachensis]